MRKTIDSGRRIVVRLWRDINQSSVRAATVVIDDSARLGGQVLVRYDDGEREWVWRHLVVRP